MLFSEILADAYHATGNPSSPQAATVAAFKRYVNEGLRLILADPAMQRALDSDTPFTIASVASQARYVLPESIAYIRGISERTNDQALRSMSLGEYRRREPDPASQTGTPVAYVPIGRVGVAVQPSNASEIFVDSTAAGDTNTAYLEGVITGGYKRTLSVSMTGTTAVSFSAAVTSFIEITDFYLSAAAVGTVTLHEDASGGTELARITIGQQRPRYQGFYLWPTPAAAVDYLVDYRQELVELVNTGDEPPFNADFHYILSAYARMRYWEGADDTRFKIALGHFQKAFSNLKYAYATSPDELPVVGRSAPVEHSRLGAWYPPDNF